MVTMQQIEVFCHNLAREFQPEKVILFGSYAWGTPTADSDVDLLVILPFEGKSVFKSVEMRLKLRPRFPLDLVVRTPEKVRERLEMGDDFMKELLEEGKILYEAYHCRVDRQS
jgi:predicted nucleotidyltransferase